MEQEQPFELSHSEQVNEIAAALAKAQGDVKNAVKGKQNDYFTSKYADLAAVIEACRDALTKNGIAVVQSPGRRGGDVSMTTMLLHASGQWMRGVCWVPPAKLDAQGFGSACSYLRRYSLAAMVGVASEDDDGESAVGRGKAENRGSAKAPEPADDPPIREAEVSLLHDAILAAGKSIDAACKAFKVTSLTDLKTSQAKKLWEKLKQKEEAA